MKNYENKIDKILEENEKEKEHKRRMLAIKCQLKIDPKLLDTVSTQTNSRLINFGTKIYFN